MYFRNPYIEEYEECSDGVLDAYHIITKGSTVSGGALVTTYRVGGYFS